MRQITIVNDDGFMTCCEGRFGGSRREWTVTGEVDIFIKGTFDKTEYPVAANLACNIAQGMNIPLSMLKRVSSFTTRGNKSSDKQKPLF